MEIITVLMDYDGTLHDHDGVLINKFDGILGLSGEEFYHIWRFDIHRNLVHRNYLDRHDDILFHCKLLFKHLETPYDKKIATSIYQKHNEATNLARDNPSYFDDAIPSLNNLFESGIILCLSTGQDAQKKAKRIEDNFGINFFKHVFSEQRLGYLKTSTDYYRKILNITRSPPRKTVSVGDTPLSDIRPAKLLGIKTIWLNRREEPKPNNSDQIADYEVDSLTEAVNLILYGS